MTNASTCEDLPYGVDDLLEEAAWNARTAAPDATVVSRVMRVEEPVPEAFVIASKLHSTPPPAPPPSFVISTGAHVSPERVARRRSAPPPDAIASALFVGVLGLVVAAGSAVAVLIA
jgi:hypothetical protein